MRPGSSDRGGPLPGGGTGYALTVVAAPGPDFPLNVMYDGARFDTASVVRLLGHLEVLLEAIAQRPRAAAARAATAGLRRRDRAARVGREPRRRAGRRTLPQRLAAPGRADARRRGRGVRGRRLTLPRAERAGRRAGAPAPARSGSAPACWSGVCLERSLEMVVALLGVLEAGGGLRADRSRPIRGERVAFMLDGRRRCRCVLTQAALRGDACRTAARVLCRRTSAVGPGGRARGRAAARAAARRPGLRDLHLGLDRPAQGRRGRRTARCSNFLASMRARAGLRSRDVAARGDHAVVRHRGAWSCSCRWSSAATADRGRAEEARRRTARAARAGCEQPAPTVHAGDARRPGAMLLDAGWRGDAARSSRCAAARPCRASSRRSCRRARGVESGTCTARPRPRSGRPLLAGAEARRAAACRSAGRSRNTRVYVLDRERRPVPVGVAGELYIGGAGLARGYLGRPELTAERFVPDPFAAARRRGCTAPATWRAGAPTGRSSSSGRIDHQVKMRGFRIELGEIEAALRGHPERARGAVVVAREDRPATQRLVGLRGRAGDGALDRRRPLPRAAPPPAGALPDYMVPAAFVALDAFPLTPNGKVDRRRPARAGRRRPAGSARLRRAARRRRGALAGGDLAEVPGRWSASGVHDDFFDLGGHSLLATRVVVAPARRASASSCRCAASSSAPTVAGAGRGGRATRGAAAARPRSAAARPGGARRPLPLSFAQERLWFLDQLEPGTRRLQHAVALRAARARSTARRCERSLAEIVRRHEALRTTLRGRGRRARRRSSPPAAARCSRAGGPRAGCRRAPRGAAGAAGCVEEARRPFDLARGPLLRAALLRLGADEHLLLLSMHHIVADGWSLGVLVGELGRALRARSRRGGRRRCAELPRPVRRLRGLAARAGCRARCWTRQLAYWSARSPARRRCSSCPPTGRARRCRRFRGAQRASTLPAGARRGAAGAGPPARARRCSWCCSPPSRRCSAATPARTTSWSARRSPGRTRAESSRA